MSVVNSGFAWADLDDPLREELGAIGRTEAYGPILDLTNDLIESSADIEHIITFLDDSPTAEHRRLAAVLRRIFCQVLEERLDALERDFSDDRYRLYAALFDLHLIDKNPERLRGVLTLNYDDYVEQAIAAVNGTEVDYGFRTEPSADREPTVTVLKLHGSFDWVDRWPVRRTKSGDHLWIPPGIRKEKQRYPFNILWGRAREILDCDILRIVGCRLSPNDWDLVSLLFSTQHGGPTPYSVEIIDAPSRAFELNERYPYLRVQSLVHIEDDGIGNEVVAHLVGGEPRKFDQLDEQRKEDLLKKEDNWFRVWLALKADALNANPAIGPIPEDRVNVLRLLAGR